MMTIPRTPVQPAAQPRRLAARGFTMVELMIVVVIVSILAAVAIPGYSRYVVSANRTAAQAEMMTITNKEEQYLIANRVYGNKAALGYSIPASVASKYDWDVTVGSGTVPSYLITFTPKATGSQAADGAMTLDNQGNKTPAAKWK